MNFKFAKLILLISAVSASSAHAHDWYRWRGPEQDGVSREKGIVSKWSPEGENLIWKNEIGGMSSPIVMNGKVYTISRSGEVEAGGAPGPTGKTGPTKQGPYVGGAAK